MPTLPFPPFEPDKSPFNVTASDAMLNVLPAADGWKSMPDVTVVSEALASACVGAIYYKDSSGNVTIFAATETDLYTMSTASTPYTWTNVSKSAAAYSVPTGEKAALVGFGTYIFANNLGTTPQKFNVGSDSAFSDNTNMPQAKYMWTAGPYVVCGHLTTSVSSVQWSGLEDGTFWTVGERGSDIQDRPGGGEVQGGLGDQRGAVVFFRDKIEYMQFVPDSDWTFTFAQGNPARGVVAPYSIAQIGPGRFVYLCEDGFFEGIQGRPIGGERVDAWFKSQVDTDQLPDVRAYADPFEKIVWWRYTKADQTSELIGWDWQLDRWCRSDQDLEEAGTLATAALSWDGLDSLYATIDDASIPFDSRIFQGGRPTFAIFTTAHKLAFLTGSAKAATLETATTELNPGMRSFVNGGRLIGDVPTYTAQIGHADYHGDSITWKSAVSPSSRSAHIPFRASGRLHRARINIAASATWNVVSAIELKAPQEGNA